MTLRLSKNFHGVDIGPLSKILGVKGYFLSVAKVVHRIGCGSWYPNLKRHLLLIMYKNIFFIVFSGNYTPAKSNRVLDNIICYWKIIYVITNEKFQSKTLTWAHRKTNANQIWNVFLRELNKWKQISLKISWFLDLCAFSKSFMWYI